MRIVGLAWQGYALPFRTPYVTSQGRATLKYGLLVSVQSDGGLVGIGEASPVGPGSIVQVRQAATLLEKLAPQMLGQQVSSGPFFVPENIAPGWANIEASRALAFGLETAFLDLLGKAEGKTVAELLGGAPQQLFVNAIIASGSPSAAAAEAATAVAQGFSSLKLKVGHGLGADEALVGAVREAVGDSVKLRIDPNHGWTVPVAIDTISRLSKYNLEYVEQPVQARDLADMAAVRRSTRVPIAADEALISPADVERIVQADAADLFILKAARLGGLHASLQAAQAAARWGKACVVTSSLESDVGLAASAHLASALASRAFAHGLATGLLYQEDLLEKPLLPEQGILATPQGPGLGVAIDRKQVQRYAIAVTGNAGAPVAW